MDHFNSEDLTVMIRSEAIVRSPNAPALARKLVAHLGRRAEIDVLPSGYAIRTSFGGYCLMTVTDDCMSLSAEAEELDILRRTEAVIGQHSERFGHREKLQVIWEDASETSD